MDAFSVINGNDTLHSLTGIAQFHEMPCGGVVINIEIYGLPNPPDSGFFGLHIHEFGDCTPPFNKTGMHYNPTNQSHPNHAGDLPPLLSNHGYAWMSVYTTRFSVTDIIGKSIVIHNMRDDFTSQPSGDSGEKIACGVIQSIK